MYRHRDQDTVAPLHRDRLVAYTFYMRMYGVSTALSALRYILFYKHTSLSGIRHFIYRKIQSHPRNMVCLKTIT